MGASALALAGQPRRWRRIFPTGVRPLLFSYVCHLQRPFSMPGLQQQFWAWQQLAPWRRSPESALDKALAVRVQDWRRERGLLDDFALICLQHLQAGAFGAGSRVTTGARCALHHPWQLLAWQGIGERGSLLGSLMRLGLVQALWPCQHRQQLTKRAEKVTVQNALRSSRASFSSREVLPTGAVGPGGVHHGGHARTGPLIACHQAKVNMDLQMIQWPRRVASRPHKRGQAAVMEPSMVNHLERRIVQMFAAGEERWSALLGGWLVMAGVLRYKHVTMAEPRKITQSALHAHCLKGKQKKLRQGFSFMIPSTFLSGFPWAEVFFEAWKALPRTTQRTSGLCFARDGRPWALSEVNLVLRAEFNSYLEDADVSTYSFRRLGSLLKFSGTELCALGDWQDRSPIGRGVSHAHALLRRSLLAEFQAEVRSPGGAQDAAGFH